MLWELDEGGWEISDGESVGGVMEFLGMGGCEVRGAFELKLEDGLVHLHALRLLRRSLSIFCDVNSKCTLISDFILLAHETCAFEARLQNLSTVVGAGDIWGSDPPPGARQEAVTGCELGLRGLEDCEGHVVKRLGGERWPGTCEIGKARC